MVTFLSLPSVPLFKKDLDIQQNIHYAEGSVEAAIVVVISLAVQLAECHKSLLVPPYYEQGRAQKRLQWMGRTQSL